METTALTMFNNTVKYAGDSIFIKPFCDFFQINYDNQCRKIKNSPLLQRSAGKNTDKSLFGDERERVTLTKQGFITWILQINPSNVLVSLREKLLQYQLLIFDFLFGSVKREEEAKLNYTRLKKLRRLKTIINTEIIRCERQFQGYLNGKFIQTEIPFSEIEKRNK